MGLEKKFYDWQDVGDINAQSGTTTGHGVLAPLFETSGPNQNQNPQGVSVGTGPTERIGRKISISAIYIDITLTFRWFQATHDALVPTRYKIWIVLDKQSNGSGDAFDFVVAPVGTGQTFVSAYRDLTNSRRYKVFKTIEGVVQPPENHDTNDVGGEFYNDQARKFQIAINFKKKPFTMIYNDTATGAFDWNQVPSYAFKPIVGISGSKTNEATLDYGALRYEVNGRTRFYDA